MLPLEIQNTQSHLLLFVYKTLDLYKKQIIAMDRNWEEGVRIELMGDKVRGRLSLV